ncbi:1-(5-phosphoribosyl)-5-[(5-phosphoribosylamino)methylideneamino]imidazole-4-carboxamide isomerase [Clostridium formicaceticum]|uniref:1-(5-phosphoribosyl)-5-[(5-phosphoribosylamino)methylideneamino] imidazole-4-carboxamide isomerase n=1 Tax=Clostridium formicaceticum TaxID=1497 RepID=A0AAC9RHX5_9CLOT|nr:1-(5-phosphoribosyl)-5-[(5-phosphoribosylamino)methylideneamino]imidazole-4-carboxamide isomerase [Clostridium formicaceticum]AOY75555.1 1-(5-phosphoribosyl)-5-[(5-phosphoribosylamino)methylideneamino]imidazole-4-carboxamide isomerase [Clostridium formicaceticum]ARE85854.1 1-(5-phosphoribosyl)-5-[(5-phosphoribosylamino)methylideneamino] imidazole-4-carboxamide isomerase [Clostridium formicaceticum]
MIIYPAIDIKEGKCVRLTQGKFDEEKVYFKDPQQVAKLWQQKGAKILHVVDLDGALEGRSKNLSVIEEIVKAVDIPVQLGGGIRSLQTIEELMKVGVDRVIIGTKAIQDKGMLQEAVAAYGDKIIVSIDAKDGYVAIDGWTKTSEVTALELALEIEKMGVKTIVYTDIARDGMLKGPNFEAIQHLQSHVKVDIIASGGVSSLEDLKKLSDIGVAGAIVGKALYEGKVDLEEVKVG